MDAKELVNRLTEEDIIKIMESLGSSISSKSNNNQLIFQTVCHHEEPDEGDYKLYFYISSKNFYCYQKCGNLSLFDVIMKSKNISFKESVQYVYDIINKKHRPKRGVGNKKYISKPLNEVVIEEIKPIKKQFLYNMYSKEPIKQWLNEDINKEAMNKFNIRYDKINNRAIIPHFRWQDGKCIGIRVRVFNEIELLKGTPKYMPLWYDDICFSSPLGSNLYGLNISKENIKKYHKVIVFESEKSCMKYDTFYPNSNISVAICGSNFSNIQKKILIDLGVEEVVLALDKEFEVYGDQESIEYEKKLIKQLDGIKDYCRCSYIIDENNLLDKKDAPVDKEKKIFEKLIKDRKYIN